MSPRRMWVKVGVPGFEAAGSKVSYRLQERADIGR